MRQASASSTRGKKKSPAGKSASSRGGAQHRTAGRPSSSTKSQGPSSRHSSGRSNSSSGRGNGSSGRGNSSSGRSNGSSGRSTGTRGSSTDSARGARMSNSGERSNMRGNTMSEAASRNRASRSTTKGESHDGRSQGLAYLEKFFLDQLQDIYYAEHKIVQSLPKMIDAATTDELSEAFDDHLHLTQRHIRRLEKVFESVGQKAEAKKCEAIEGIAREVEQIIRETEPGSLTRDAALIIAAQKVEHYEIATYGGLVQLAITMQLHDAADLLDKTLMEEEDTDALLTVIAENDINLRAENEGNEYSWNATMIYSTGSGEEEEEEEEEEGELREELNEETEGDEQSDSPLM